MATNEGFKRGSLVIFLECKRTFSFPQFFFCLDTLKRLPKSSDDSEYREAGVLGGKTPARRSREIDPCFVFRWAKKKSIPALRAYRYLRSLLQNRELQDPFGEYQLICGSSTSLLTVERRACLACGPFALSRRRIPLPPMFRKKGTRRPLDRTNQSEMSRDDLARASENAVLVMSGKNEIC